MIEQTGPLRIFPDPVLAMRANEVLDYDGIPELGQHLVRTMFQTGGVGLAANQVGRLQRVIAVRDMDAEQVENAKRKDDKREFLSLVMVNPVIVERSDESDARLEGCLSFPRYVISVRRALRVKVLAQDLTGETFDFEADGLPARVIQHEIDHLDGKTILDYALYPEKRYMAVDLAFQAKARDSERLSELSDLARARSHVIGVSS